MTAEELEVWRVKSERLRELTIAMDQSETRAAAAFAAGAMLGLANRLYSHPGSPVPVANLDRLVAAARAMLEAETEVAQASYSVDGERLEDEDWVEEDPEGAAIAIELRRALAPFR